MLLISVGIFIGVLVSLGALGPLGGALGWVVEQLCQAGLSLSGRLVGKLADASGQFGSLGDVGALQATLMAALTVAMPGLVALLLAFVARSGVNTRRVIAAGLGLFAVTSFVAVNAQTGLTFLMATAIIVLLSLLGAKPLRVVSAAGATLLAIEVCRAVADDRVTAIMRVQETVVATSGLSNEVVHALLIAVALAPAVAAGFVLVTDRDRRSSDPADADEAAGAA